MSHVPVLLAEVLAALIPHEPPLRAIDGTLGAGGHTRALLERGAGHVLAFDLDPQAVALAREATAPYAARLTIVQDSYERMAEHARRLGWEASTRSCSIWACRRCSSTPQSAALPSATRPR